MLCYQYHTNGAPPPHTFKWHHSNIILMGDVAFTSGSALRDAITLHYYAKDRHCHLHQQYNPQPFPYLQRHPACLNYAAALKLTGQCWVLEEARNSCSTRRMIFSCRVYPFAGPGKHLGSGSEQELSFLWSGDQKILLLESGGVVINSKHLRIGAKFSSVSNGLLANWKSKFVPCYAFQIKTENETNPLLSDANAEKSKISFVNVFCFQGNSLIGKTVSAPS